MIRDEDVKSKILKQAQVLFQQFGLKKTTMDEIAFECGKAKSTLYHYYKSKEEVFDAVIEMELRNLRKAIKEKVDAVGSVKDKIIVYLTEFHKEVMYRVNLYRIVKHELVTKAIAQEHFSRIIQFEKSYVTRILEDGFDTGEFIQVNKDEIPWFSELLLTAFFGIVRYSIEADKGYDFKKLESAAHIFIPKLFS